MNYKMAAPTLCHHEGPCLILAPLFLELFFLFSQKSESLFAVQDLNYPKKHTNERPKPEVVSRVSVDTPSLNSHHGLADYY